MGADKVRGEEVDMETDMEMAMGEGTATQATVKAEGKFMEVMEEGMAVEEVINETREAHNLHDGQVPGHESSTCESVNI